jgi:hypothetical protein
MELQTKKKRKVFSLILMAVVMGFSFSSCGGGDDGGDDPSPSPSSGTSLTLNPSNLNFTAEKNDSKSFEIQTDADATWVIYGQECDSWLSISSTQGRGTTRITLTTKDVNTGGKLQAQIEVVAQKSGGAETSRTLYVSRDGGIEDNCFARIMENGQLIMTYGMACVVDFGNNTQYFYYKIYTDAEFNNIKGDNNRIVQEATKSGSDWTRVNIPSSGGVEICYDQCQPKTRYVFVTVSFATNGNHGEIYTSDFMTKPKEEEPLASITPYSQVVHEVHDGDQGPWYKWEVKKESGTCSKYYTYVCAGDTEFDMMKNHKGDFGQYDERDGVKVAWNIWLEHKGDMSTHTTSFNKGNFGGREKLFRSYSEGSTQWLTYKSTDKYLQIVTWGVDENNNYSGLVYDVIYKVENERLYPTTGYNLDVNPTSLSFTASGGTLNVTVTSNDSWTVSSNQSWCTVSETSGSNTKTITITAAANSSADSRSATVSIKGTNSGITKDISVTQEGTQGGSDNYLNRDEYGDDNNLNKK